MLRNFKDLRGYALRATDGVIGRVEDFYFDDEDWGIRYLVVNTGSWLSDRKVLISPIAVGHAGWMARRLPVALTRAQVEGSPDINTSRPVSRQHEAEYFRYYGYPYYWGGAGLWGMGAYPGSLTTEGRIEEELKTHGTHATSTPTSNDCHLRSSNAVIGHHIEATDGEIGHLEDLLIDDHTWAIRYLIVNTSKWWSGHRVLVSPDCIRDVSWSQATVSIDLTRQAVSDLPLYGSIAQLQSTS
jgi:sporulation protein YlmC with PRC-barrel domain